MTLSIKSNFLIYKEYWDDIVEPISINHPCGEPLNADPVVTQIRLAREEDDPTLPMRQWERPLKIADWALIEKLCIHTLSHQSKDLQIACWLLEAWTRQESFQGLLRGLTLIHLLLTRYWSDIHPKLEINTNTGEPVDCASRTAPLKWLNQVLSFTLNVHLRLINLENNQNKFLSLIEWDRLTVLELSPELSKTDHNDNDLTTLTDEKIRNKNDLISYAQKYQSVTVLNNLEIISICKELLNDINFHVDSKLGLDGPSFSTLISTFEKIERVLLQLSPSIELQINSHINTENSNPGQESSISKIFSHNLFGGTEVMTKSDLNDIKNSNITELQSNQFRIENQWTDRKNAYAALRSIADFLSKEEPHSITPYLLRKAIYWGEMPLHDLLNAIMKNDGDWANLVRIFEIKK